MMVATPPHTEWENFSVAPSLKCSSGVSGWRCGGVFYEFILPQRGVFNGYTDSVWTVAWTLTPLKVRCGGPRSEYNYVPQHPYICVPGHHYHGEWEGAAQSIVLHVSMETMKDRVLHVGKDGFVQPNEAAVAPLEHLMRILHADVRSGSPAGPTIGETVVCQILHHLFPDSDRNHSLEHRDGSTKKVAKACEFIEAHLSERLSLADLAAACGLSMRHFCRAFRAATRLSPHDYIVRRRVETARRLIGDGRSSLSEIAYMVGFSSHAHMSATFQKLLGVPPSHFCRRTGALGVGASPWLDPESSASHS